MENSLISKYRRDELTVRELAELKMSIAGMTEKELEQQLYENWLNDYSDISCVCDETVNKLKNSIDGVIRKKRTVFPLLARCAQIAAAILLPLLMVFTIYLYRENRIIMDGKIYVETGKTERASITLPDGTVVTLNAESKLGYDPKGYNRKERKISFSGEGYFQVAHNGELPFSIHAEGAQVNVFGTVFNFSIRDNDTTAMLSLEQGRVSILSLQTSENVVLNKNQTAILNKLTGNITVIFDKNITDRSAWRRGDMIFRNTGLSQVFRTIEENYNIKIKYTSSKYISDTFTGTLPVTDLNEALEIIERSYHVKSVINGKEVSIKSR
ncbi:MAG: FecR domain-containing protein [Dysgonamonadaceae bacterium]|nr:FecR domain-containing protein [Dysgonamonadaceae bacterium]